MTIRKQFKAEVAVLRERYPLPYPAKVYLRLIHRSHDCVGYTYLVKHKNGRPSHFVIAVDIRGYNWTLIQDTLIHEWAHALTWEEVETEDPHSKRWGQKYAELHREMVAS